MRGIVLVLWMTALVVSMVVVSAFPTLAAPPLSASNMGVCSSFLGQQKTKDNDNVRAEVNHLVKDIGIENPGELYKVRAQQHNNRPPEEECLPRPPQ